MSEHLTDDATVEIVNPDRKIATLSPEADVDMEVTVNSGKGYVPAEKNKTEDMPIGTIPIDAIFSPVQKVNYIVTPARVGRETDFDRLQLEIWTDGTITPDEKRDIIAYLGTLDESAAVGGFGMGGLGPVAEGLFAWLLGIGTLVGFAVWIAAHTTRSTKKKVEA